MDEKRGRGRPRKFDPAGFRFEEFAIPAPPSLPHDLGESRRRILEWCIKAHLKGAASVKKAA